MAENELKAKGNAAFSAGKFEEAIDLFTQAIEVNPENHVLYSNRSAARASLKEFDKALEDAQKVVELKPDWVKGYSRLGAAYHGLHKLDEALEAYNKGLEIGPENQLLKEGKMQVEAAMKQAKSPFMAPDFINRLLSDPRTSPLMGQPDFMAMIRDLQSNPQNMMKHINDPRMQLVMEVGLGLNFAAAADPASAEASKEHESDPQFEEVTTEKAPEPEPVVEEEPSEEEKEKKQTKEAALKEKEAGNAAYKKKNFDEAIEHYTKALDLWDEDITFLTNRAAVYLEMGNYDKCIEDCDSAVSKGTELHTDFKIIAKAMTRKGKALVKLERYDEAIEIFNQSLTEHRNADTLNALRETEKILKDAQDKAYVDLDLCAQEKEAGNEAFKLQQYPEAVKHYTEALKRGPPEVNEEAYKLYSNRAACYTKLCAWFDGLKDAEKCIELKPDFGKGYSRKGNIQFFMKEYDKAMESYKQGLEVDPDSEEMKDGLQRCVQQISRFARGEATEAELEERRKRAMADPEIQQILTDPVIAQVLKDFESDPRGAQQHLRNPEIMTKLNKLITAGIVKVQ